eukprot:EG_transcript_9190
MRLWGLLALLLWGRPGPGAAEEVRWTGASGVDKLWDTPGNWEGGAPPQPNDDVILATGVVELLNDTFASCSSIQISASGHLRMAQNLLVSAGGLTIRDGGQVTVFDGAYLVLESEGFVGATGTLRLVSGVISGDWVSFGDVLFEGPEAKGLFLGRFVNSGRMVVGGGWLHLNASSLSNNGSLEVRATSGPTEAGIECWPAGEVIQSDGGVVVVSNALCGPSAGCRATISGALDLASVDVQDRVTLVLRSPQQPSIVRSLWLSGPGSVAVLEAGDTEVVLGDVASHAGTLVVARNASVTGRLDVGAVRASAALSLRSPAAAAIGTLTLAGGGVHSAAPLCAVQRLEVESGDTWLAGMPFIVTQGIIASSEELELAALLTIQESLAVSPPDLQPARLLLRNGSLAVPAAARALVERLEVTAQGSGEVQLDGSIVVRGGVDGRGVAFGGAGKWRVERKGRLIVREGSFHASDVGLEGGAILEGVNSTLELDLLTSGKELGYSQGGSWFTTPGEMRSLRFPAPTEFVFTAVPDAPDPVPPPG